MYKLSYQKRDENFIFLRDYFEEKWYKFLSLDTKFVFLSRDSKVYEYVFASKLNPTTVDKSCIGQIHILFPIMSKRTMIS